MANGKGFLSKSLNTFKYIRSDGETLPADLAQKFYSIADELLDGDDLADERRSYKGSVGNFFAEKSVDTSIP